MKNRRHASASQFLVYWILFAFVVAATVAQAAQPSRWTIVPIMPLAAQGGTTALGINNRGQVVGYGTVNDPVQGTALHGFVWDNGTMIDIGVAPGAVSRHSTAYAINDKGTVTASIGLNGYTWNDGTWTLQTLPDFGRYINKSGTLAGTYRPGRFLMHGFISRDGVFTDIGTLGGETSEIYAINDKGVVVGKSQLANNFDTHPFIYENGVMKDLGTFGGYFGVANAINSHGTVVGSAWDVAHIAHAFVYDGAGIRMLFPGMAGNSTAVGINDHGAVIGWMNGITTSYVYDNGVLTMLEDIPEVRAGGWSWLVPTGINDRGWITGYANKVGSPGGVAFVLIPK